MKDLFAGLSYLRGGFVLLGRPGLRRFVVMPLLVNLLLFGGLLWWAFGWVEAASQYLLELLPGWLQWLSRLLVPVFVLTSLVLVIGLLALGRLYGSVVGSGEITAYTWGAMCYEFATAILAFVALRKASAV